MTFANPLPGWILALVVLAAALTAWVAYRPAPFGAGRRAWLSGLRFITLLWLLVCLMRPTLHVAARSTRDTVVPILVDVSRSMGIADDFGHRRIEAARTLLASRLLPALEGRFHPEILRFGERIASADVQSLTPDDRRTALGAALEDVRDRYRDRRVAGIVLISDGGNTGARDLGAAAAAGAPVYAIPVGSRTLARDREVLSIVAGDPIVTDSIVELAATAVSHGYGTSPIELRLLEDGRLIDVRRPVPAADGVPVREVFHVTPNRDRPSLYTVEIAAAGEDLVPENDVRRVLVPAASRPRRILMIEGAPGFEQGFLQRSWSGDRGLEIDSVVRKGRDDSGAGTYYVQAARSRAEALTAGYPLTREALFHYDVVVLANVDAGVFRQSQLALTRSFVGERGGGLLVLGGRTFEGQGLRGTPLEDVLPLELSGRTGSVASGAEPPGTNRVALTGAGADHPMMQLASTSADTEKRWQAVPALASVAPLGGARPGASVLAVTGGPGGAARALVAVQQFGEGRSMIFAGEAAWRWRMMLPAADRSYDRFWRQAARWLGATAPDPVALTIASSPAAGEDLQIGVTARDAGFTPQPDATVDLRVVSPGGATSRVPVQPDPVHPGMFRGTLPSAAPGVYRVSADARRGSTPLGTASTSVLVGGVDPEMADPRSNVEVLERVARASGGQVVAAADAASIANKLDTATSSPSGAESRDLWNTAWSFAGVLVLLSAEWLTRRAWGLR